MTSVNFGQLRAPIKTFFLLLESLACGINLTGQKGVCTAILRWEVNIPPCDYANLWRDTTLRLH